MVRWFNSFFGVSSVMALIVVLVRYRFLSRNMTYNVKTYTLCAL